MAGNAGMSTGMAGAARSLLVLVVVAGFGAALLLAGCFDDTDGLSTSAQGAGEADGEGVLPRLGSVDDEGHFHDGQLQLDLDTIAYGARVGVSARLIDAEGEPITEEGQWQGRLTSPCLEDERAEVVSPVTFVSGDVGATYQADGCVGSDRLEFTLEHPDHGEISAEAELTVLPRVAGSLSFVEADPHHLSLKGMAGLQPQTARVTFRLTDRDREPIEGREVEFTLSTTVGGTRLLIASDRTDANGLASTTVQSGSVATPVRVQARVASLERHGQTESDLYGQSEQLWISTGIPEEQGLSISVDVRNPHAWEVDGTEVTVTARARDRFSHPVIDGTTISFSAEGGRIEPSCQTVHGTCSVTWTSQNPRPVFGSEERRGRVSILVYAIGEESFIDRTGDGRFGTVEAGFGGCSREEWEDYRGGAGDSGSCGWLDTGEPFRDDNENRAYDPGIDGFFFDFNENGRYTPPSGFFDGLLCEGSARCGERFAPIGYNTVIVMSSSELEVTAGEFNWTEWDVSTRGRAITVTVQDINGNAPPVGTSVALNLESPRHSGHTPFRLIGASSVEVGGGSTEPFEHTFTLGGTGDETMAELVITAPDSRVRQRSFTIVP
ncbi:hypothetical protein CKO15_10465 [Halorhodospira abdelmalekii]|nr:hypothetical protein [Halorhodospira abdelmalekii]